MLQLANKQCPPATIQYFFIKFQLFLPKQTINTFILTHFLPQKCYLDIIESFKKSLCWANSDFIKMSVTLHILPKRKQILITCTKPLKKIWIQYSKPPKNITKINSSCDKCKCQTKYEFQFWSKFALKHNHNNNM